ncbi:MAG: hypothetical protein ACODAC_07930 [Pseudomonadota bacterium]
MKLPVARRWAAPRPVAALAMLLAASAGHAAGMPDMVAEVLALGPQDPEARCGYVRVSIDSDGSETERYDPSNPERPWELVAVDGEPPSERQLANYRSDADDRRDRQHPLDFDLRSMVDPNGWSLRSESATEAAFGFRLRPNEDLRERVIDKVRGTLLVGKDPLRPVRITIENTEPAYVAPFVRIVEYFQELRFRWDDELEGPVLAEIETRRRGRALLVKSLDKDKTVYYDEYHCAG